MKHPDDVIFMFHLTTTINALYSSCTQIWNWNIAQRSKQMREIHDKKPPYIRLTEPFAHSFFYSFFYSLHCFFPHFFAHTRSLFLSLFLSLSHTQPNNQTNKHGLIRFSSICLVFFYYSCLSHAHKNDTTTKTNQ